MTTIVDATFDVAQPIDAALGEGPHWDTATGRLLWVDITSRTVHRLDPASGRDEPLVLDRPVGAAVPWTNDRLAVAVAGGFGSIDTADGHFAWLARVETDRPLNRMNDAKCDPSGRFWGGTIATDLAAGAGTLYRLDRDCTAHAVVGGLWVSNGLGWSPDGRTMYLIDSFAYGLDAFDFDAASGTLARRRRLVDVPASEGLLDGMTVDATGAIWVALFGGWSLRRYRPDGRLDTILRLPVSQVTSCAFGGSDLGELYVTTARQDEHGAMSEEQLSAQPLAGSVLVLRPGIDGLAGQAYAGDV